LPCEPTCAACTRALGRSIVSIRGESTGSRADQRGWYGGAEDGETRDRAVSVTPNDAAMIERIGGDRSAEARDRAV